jgi:hypothetical protein
MFIEWPVGVPWVAGGGYFMSLARKLGRQTFTPRTFGLHLVLPVYDCQWKTLEFSAANLRNCIDHRFGNGIGIALAVAWNGNSRKSEAESGWA